MTGGPLSRDDLEQFRTKGWVRTRTYAPEDVAAMEEMVWRRLASHGVDRHDPCTWSADIRPGRLSHNIRKTDLFRRPPADEFCAVATQLLGTEGWHYGKDMGMLLYTFPQVLDSWDVARGWHWHGHPQINVDRVRELFVFTFLNEVGPEQGGTLILEGSHHLVTDFMARLPNRESVKAKDQKRLFHAQDPWLKALASERDEGDRRARFMEAPTQVLGHDLRVVELTGSPGEAVVTHCSVMHAISMNATDRPRFMRATGIGLGKPPG